MKIDVNFAYTHLLKILLRTYFGNYTDILLSICCYYKQSGLIIYTYMVIYKLLIYIINITIAYKIYTFINT